MAVNTEKVRELVSGDRDVVGSILEYLSLFHEFSSDTNTEIMRVLALMQEAGLVSQDEEGAYFKTHEALDPSPELLALLPKRESAGVS